MRKICYVSGSRADFGLISSALKKASHNPILDISVCITGMHCLDGIGELGKTEEEIVSSGIKICGVIRTPSLQKKNGTGMAQAIAMQLSGFVEVFEKEKFDAIMVLGDRGEMLAAAIAAIHLGIPVVHIHGGELSGTVDEPVRHAISKLSHYHFTSTESARERLIKMGELPQSIFVTGAPGIDDIKIQKFIPKEELYQSVGFDVNKKTCIVIYHPVLQEEEFSGTQVYDLLDVIKRKDLHAIVLSPNTDAGSGNILKKLNEFKSFPLFRFFDHLSRPEYLNWLNACDFMIGNSSSGIIEACSLNKSVIDVGSRQRMREVSENLTRTSNDPADIGRAIDNILLDKNEKKWHNVYGDGDAGNKIVDLLTIIDLSPSVLNKVNTY